MRLARGAAGVVSLRRFSGIGPPAFAAEVPAADLAEALREGAGNLLEDLHLVDDYRGQGIAEGAKSLTFALRFRAADRTLTAAEATTAKLAGVAVAEERHGAAIRD